MMKIIATMILTCFLLSACGQKGPLSLEEPVQETKIKETEIGSVAGDANNSESPLDTLETP